MGHRIHYTKLKYTYKYYDMTVVKDYGYKEKRFQQDKEKRKGDC
jgi:hypothetical protein